MESTLYTTNDDIINKLCQIILKTQNIINLEQLDKFTKDKLENFINAVKNKHDAINDGKINRLDDIVILLTYGREINIAISDDTYEGKMTDEELKSLIYKYEKSIVKEIEFAICPLKMNECKKIQCEIEIKLIFNNNELIIPKNLILQSQLYLEQILRFNKAENEFIIPLDITKNALHGIETILKGNINDYYKQFKTIEDCHSFLIVFDYLGLEFDDTEDNHEE